MKKLFIISFLTFFSISAIAETNLRCKFYKVCEDEKCTSRVLEDYIQLVYSDSWFGKKISLNSKNYTEKAQFLDDVIKFDDYIFYKKSNLLRYEKRYPEGKESQNRRYFGKSEFYTAIEEYICTVIN